MFFQKDININEIPFFIIDMHHDRRIPWDFCIKFTELCDSQSMLRGF